MDARTGGTDDRNEITHHKDGFLGPIAISHDGDRTLHRRGQATTRTSSPSSAARRARYRQPRDNLTVVIVPGQPRTWISGGILGTNDDDGIVTWTDGTQTESTSAMAEIADDLNGWELQ